MRLVLILLIGLGLLLPRAGAVLAEVAGFEAVVICQGDALVTAVLDRDGVPVEAEIEDHGPCLAAAFSGRAGAPSPVWAELVPPPHRGLRPRAGPLPAPRDGPAPMRGPPAIV